MKEIEIQLMIMEVISQVEDLLKTKEFRENLIRETFKQLLQKNLEEKISILNKYKLASISPVSTSITNLIDEAEGENIAIINIENETQITTVINGQINRVDILNSGKEE